MYIENEGIKNFFDGGVYAQAVRDCRDGKNVSVFNAQFFERTFFAAAAAGGVGVYVTADLAAAREAASQLKGLMDGVVLLSPQEDVLTYKKLAVSSGRSERLRALYDAAAGRARMIVTTAAALTQLYPSPAAFIKQAFTLKKGGVYDLSALQSALADMGYKNVGAVTEAGQFSVRGDILDVWGEGEEGPVRAEFFGDELETLRSLDPVTCLSGSEADEAEIIPASDVFYTAEQAGRAEAALNEETRAAAGSPAGERVAAIAADLKVKLHTFSRSPSLKFLQPFFFETTFAGFVRPDIVFYDDAKQVYDTLSALYLEHQSRIKTLRGSGEVMGFSRRALIDREEAVAFTCPQTAFHRLNSNNRIFSPQAVYTFDGMKLPDYSHDFRQLADDLIAWQGNYGVEIYCGSREAAQNFSAFMSEHGIGAGAVTLLSSRLDRGGIFHALKRVVIGTYDFSSKRARPAARRRARAVFTVPEVGDYVVHSVHGIGLCRNVQKLNLTGAERDYLIIEYSGGDKLMVPVENMDSLSRYVASGQPPKLSKIGGADFEKVKSRVKASVKALAFDLVKLYAERARRKGYRYDGDESLLEEFAADFPYQETEDQLRAIEEGLKDLRGGKIMDRLLCGDVGYGKTEVALRIAFKVITSGRQVAFLAPTTILAGQHFETARARMERYGVKVERLTRFDSPSASKETLARLKSGECDMVCGTHRLLSRGVSFKNLGLLILDEEQRFGVADKEKLKLLRPDVNVLSMSATPIPRTLYMTMVSVRDISVLDTPPAERIPVQTFVTEYSDALVRDAVAREVGRGGQAFIVYNRVAGIDGFAAKMKELMPDVRFSVAHGRLPEDVLERTISEFLSGGADVLVASTIIENGIDMPRANTLIVIDADRLGLAQLYQLRGRV